MMMMRSVFWFGFDYEYILTTKTELFFQKMPEGYERVDPFEATWAVRSEWGHRSGAVWPLRNLVQEAWGGGSCDRVPYEDHEVLDTVERELGGRDPIHFPTLVLLRKKRRPWSGEHTSPEKEDTPAPPDLVDEEEVQVRQEEDLYLRLDLDPDELAESKEALRLFSSDGTYDESKKVAEAGVVEQDYVDVIFKWVPTALSYSLEVTPDDGKPYLLYQDVPFAKLDGLADAADDDEPEYPLEPEPEDD